MSLILIILVILMLGGLTGPIGGYHTYGYFPSGILLIIIIIVLLFGYR